MADKDRGDLPQLRQDEMKRITEYADCTYQAETLAIPIADLTIAFCLMAWELADNVSRLLFT